MKGLFKSRKGLALLTTLVVAGASAFAAYAFFTASGGGTGSSSAPSSTQSWENSNGGSNVAYNDGSVTGLWPGNPADVLSAPTLYNPNPGPLQLQQVTVVMTLGGPVTYGHGAADCDARNFTFVDPGASWTFSHPAGENTASDYSQVATYDVPVGKFDVSADSLATEPLPALSLTLLNDTNTNQDACEGATVSLVTSLT